MSKKKRQKIGKINPNEIKSRDILHMQEFLNQGGSGSWKSDKDYDRKKLRKEEKDIENE